MLTDDDIIGLFSIEEEDQQNDEENDENVAVFVETNRGKTVLIYNGHRYRKAYGTKNGFRWVCSINKNCNAYLHLNDKDEILMCNQEHHHKKPAKTEYVDADQSGNYLF